jgi:hypothetical protein
VCAAFIVALAYNTACDVRFSWTNGFGIKGKSWSLVMVGSLLAAADNMLAFCVAEPPLGFDDGNESLDAVLVVVHLLI